MLLCSKSEKALTIVRVSGALLELQLRWVPSGSFILHRCKPTLC